MDKCFGSLVNSSIPLKILTIDNASTDGTPTLIREKFPQVEVIETGQNLGFGKANNIGLKRVLDENADYAFIHHIILTYPKYISKRTAIKHSFWHLAHSFYKFPNNIKSTIIFIIYEFPKIWKKTQKTNSTI